MLCFLIFLTQYIVKKRLSTPKICPIIILVVFTGVGKNTHLISGVNQKLKDVTYV